MIFVKAEERKLLVKGLAVRARVAATVVVYLTAAGGASVTALPPGPVLSAPGISIVAEGSSERWIVDLGGVLVAVLAPDLADREAELLLLVRPPKRADGPRRLLRLRLAPEPRLDLLAEGLEGWIDALAAIELDAGRGPELVAGGPGRLATLGSLSPLAAPVAGRPLLVADGFDLRTLQPGPVRRGVDRRFAVVAPGRLRFWEPPGAWAREMALPLAVVRSSAGLRLSSPPVARVTAGSRELYLAGPEAVGSTRLRSFLLDAAEAGGPPVEVWASLPGPEKVDQSWPFEIDGVPVLVVRTQAGDELNLFERQRLRVLTLSADRTRTGALPTLAVELDSKRWHETAIALGDVDGDGHDDLLAAFPEGLSGTDLVVQWWRGSGGGRFENRPHRSDLQKSPPGWQLVAMPQPGLFLVGNDRMELRPFTSAGRGAVAERAGLAASIPALAAVPGQGASKEATKVTISVGGESESAKVENTDPEAEPLGAVELDG
ncbi:MAG: repeat-containing protein, partial [Acidobacteriota bacterium]|nr:repeat-containing protein [Acidobacteriota bacterium]